MKAIIMAGGEGSRLRPLTCDIPKPMVPIMNIPIMEHIINLLKNHGITEIGVTVMYLRQKIKDYFGDGSNFGVKIVYFTEDLPLGTAGSVKNAESFLDDTFVVISGDCLTDMNLTNAIQYHKEKKSKATIILSRVEVPLDYGVVIADNNGLVVEFLEKPSWGEVFSDTVNTGTYIFEPEILKEIKKGPKSDFSKDIFPKLLKKKISLFGYIMEGHWCDIGDVSAYVQAHYDVIAGKISVKASLTEIQQGVWVGNGTVISPKAIINTPCFIGEYCRIGANTVIDVYSVIGNNNVIEDNVSIKRSIIWNNNYIETGSEVRGAIICNKVNLKQNVSIYENSIIGDSCIINERAVIKPNVKIWPQKTIDAHALVDRNIIWNLKQARCIFGENGVSGIINVDINPEFATRLGAAYGSLFKRGEKVVVSSTTSNSARMFKHAFISGILSVGIEVFNLSSILTPISRHAINFLAVEGGIHIKLSNDNPNKLRVDFMDAKGISISKVLERQIENAFFREDFKRCSGEEISRLNNITDFKNYYTRTILNNVDTQRVKIREFKLCIFSPSDFLISIVVPMLVDIGCKVSSHLYNSSLSNYESYIEVIKSNKADFGAVLDSNGENLVLINSDGTVIKDDLFFVLTSFIVFKTNANPKVVVPVTMTSIIEGLAEKYNGEVLRTKTSQQAVMEQLLNNIHMKNNDSMLQFLLNFDAIAGLIKIVEFLAINEETLSDTISQIPEFFMQKKNVFCPWELKGKVMRTLISDEYSQKSQLLDGVKFVLDEGWVLILPDADLPICRIYSEGPTTEIAYNNCRIYVNKIKNIINSDTVK